MTTRFIGTHAKISMGYSTYNRPIVIKTFGKIDKIATEEKAVELIQYHKRYQQIGLEIGISINPSFDIYITENKNKTRAYINEIQPYVKTNLAELLSNLSTEEEILPILKKYFLMLKRVWDNNFIISLDPPLSNFGFDENNVMKYFDFYPAYQKKEDGSYFIWPHPHINSPELLFLENRYFKSTQIWMIYAQLMKVFSKKKAISIDKVKNLVGAYLGNEAYILIDYKKIRIEKILNTIKPVTGDLLRVIACNMCFENKISCSQLFKIFELTHIDAENKLPSIEKLFSVVNIIKDSLNQENTTNNYL